MTFHKEKLHYPLNDCVQKRVWKLSKIIQQELGTLWEGKNPNTMLFECFSKKNVPKIALCSRHGSDPGQQPRVAASARHLDAVWPSCTVFSKRGIGGATSWGPDDNLRKSGPANGQTSMVLQFHVKQTFFPLYSIGGFRLWHATKGWCSWISTSTPSQLCAEVGLVVHFCLSGISLVSCYLAVRHQLPMDHLLELVGKHPEVLEGMGKWWENWTHWGFFAVLVHSKEG